MSPAAHRDSFWAEQKRFEVAVDVHREQVLNNLSLRSFQVPGWQIRAQFSGFTNWEAHWRIYFWPEGVSGAGDGKDRTQGTAEPQLGEDSPVPAVWKVAPDDPNEQEPINNGRRPPDTIKWKKTPH